LTDLKPCPFCGSENLQIHETTIASGNKTIECKNCYSNTTKSLWQDRPMLDEAVELLRECRSVIENKTGNDFRPNELIKLANKIDNQLESDSGE
jgi:transcription elongation factor Elf1